MRVARILLVRIVLVRIVLPRVLLAVAAGLFLSLPASAEGIVAGLSQNRISITANFDGSEIMVYGAVRRDAPPPEGPPLEVIITVEGPSAPAVIRRKERVAGIWVNRDSVHIDRAPSFYAVMTTAPLSQILTETENLRHQITIPRAIRAVGITDEAENSPDFVEALVRLRMAAGLYRVQEGSVDLAEQTLFRTDVILPANLTEGNYRVRLFLTRDGRVVDALDRMINVRKEGLERLIWATAHDQPLLYGLFAIAVAALAGWAASAGFRLLQR